MRVYKRGNVYHFELEFEGQRFQRSTKSKNERVANKIADAFHTALIMGRVGITQRKLAPTFSEAMKAFLAWSELEHKAHPATTDRYRWSSKPLKAHFNDCRIDTITPSEAEAYKLQRSRQTRKDGEPIAPATVNREMACLRAMFNHAGKDHPDLRNPISKTSGVRLLAENNLQDRVLTYTEEAAYLAAASETLRDVAKLILELGMRPGEVFELQVRAIALEENHLRVLSGKTKAARRQLDLTPTARAVLERRLKALENPKADDYLFPCEVDATRPLPGIQSAHARALELSKVADFRPYDMRHTFATRAAQGAMDLVTLAATLGHSRLHMVMRYAHPSQAHQTASMDKVTTYKNEQREKERARAEAEQKEMPNRGLFVVKRPA